MKLFIAVCVLQILLFTFTQAMPYSCPSKAAFCNTVICLCDNPIECAQQQELPEPEDMKISNEAQRQAKFKKILLDLPTHPVEDVLSHFSKYTTDYERQGVKCAAECYDEGDYRACWQQAEECSSDTYAAHIIYTLALRALVMYFVEPPNYYNDYEKESERLEDDQGKRKEISVALTHFWFKSEYFKAMQRPLMSEESLYSGDPSFEMRALLAKLYALIGRFDGAFAVMYTAFARFPEQRSLSRDYLTVISEMSSAEADRGVAISNQCLSQLQDAASGKITNATDILPLCRVAAKMILDDPRHEKIPNPQYINAVQHLSSKVKDEDFVFF